METSRLIFAGLACILGAAVGDMTFSVRDCAQNKAKELLNFPTVRVSPHPVKVPGDLTVSGHLTINRRASGSISLDVTIERYVGFFWMTVPCFGNVGSCTYQDVCGMLAGSYGNGTSGCPRQLVDNNIPCTCPLAAGAYPLANAVFTIPEMSGIWSWLAEGDYRVTAKLIDNASRQEMACQHLELTIVDDQVSCSGFLCSIFG